MTQVIEKIYNGRDNTIDLLLTEDGVSIQHSLITRVRVLLNDAAGTEVDSSIETDAFDWENSKLTLSFGGLLTLIQAGSYDADLIIYTITNTDGVLWTPKVGLYVYDE